VKLGLLPVMMGPPYPSQFCNAPIPCNLSKEDFNYFHTLILVDELSRCASGGVLWALGGGASIGLPPLLHFANPELRNRIAREVLNGEKSMCLAITEPHAGSDVNGIQTTAKKTSDGRFYIVNGEKKWITTGLTADYFTTAVRTGDGANALSLLLIERKSPGIKTRRMEVMGATSSGTTYIIFEDVKVPVENLIGQEGGGFKYIGYNFNHERLIIIAQAVRFSRVCYEESFTYAYQRKTFGARLIDHPVIRNKFGNMIGRIESVQSWLDSVCYQLTQMPSDEARLKLGGPIALLKVQATLLYEFCAREALQIFGGLGFTRGGIGEKVERLYRDMRAYAIGGGSEEVMLDFGVRQAMRFADLSSKL
jgi:alkylation response protein AidB-like acyl-CoA dehydrogenase